MLARQCVQRKRWELDFKARPEEVAALRRITRARLRLWGLPHVTEGAQLIVSELVTNVIEHVGVGAPSRLAVMMREAALRIEVHDPDGKVTPMSRSVAADAEGGRGLGIVGVFADRWGVDQVGVGKAVWAELDCGIAWPGGHAGGHRVDRAEALLLLYGSGPAPMGEEGQGGPLRMRENAVGLLADVMRWLASHGWDPDDVLDRAQTHFEAEAGAA